MPGEIEFLDAEQGPGDDEYLPLSGRHSGPGGGRRSRLAVGVAISVLVGGLLVARVVTSNGSKPVAGPVTSSSPIGTVRSAAPSRIGTRPQPAPVPRPSSSAVKLDPRTGLVVGLSSRSCFPSNQIGRTVRLPSSTSASEPAKSSATSTPTSGAQHCDKVAPAQCPESDDGQIACQVERDLPTAVLNAVHTFYPGARVTFAYTEIARQTRLIWYRVIRFSIAPGISLVVTLEQSGYDPGESMVRSNAARQQVYAVRADARLNTIVDLTAPNAAGADLNLPLSLVGDDRLATVD